MRICFVLIMLLYAACANDKSDKSDEGPVIVAPEPESIPDPKGAPNIQEAKSMKLWKVTRVVYNYSTYDTSKVGYPSKGPGDTYVLSAEVYEDFEALMEKVLYDTKVNNEVTLGAYIDLNWSGKREEVQRIDALGTYTKQPSGSGVNRSFALYNGETLVYKFASGLDRYSGSHISELLKLTTDPKNKIDVDPLDGSPRPRAPELPVP